jgi:hypothetical protein
MYQLVPLTKQMMEHMSLVVNELDLFDLCDIVRLKLTTYQDYPVNAHVMNDGSGDLMVVYKIELKAQGRPNLANGISLYVSDDRKVATWSLAGCEYVHGKQLV